MSSDQILALLIALAGGVGASMVTGLLSRPKTQAEAGAAEASGQVAISGDARAWAQQFADQAAAASQRAEKSELRANAAEERAERADEKADDLALRVDNLESKMAGFVTYTRTLQTEIVRLEGKVPSPPRQLIPPLVADGWL